MQENQEFMDILYYLDPVSEINQAKSPPFYKELSSNWEGFYFVSENVLRILKVISVKYYVLVFFYSLDTPVYRSDRESNWNINLFWKKGMLKMQAILLLLKFKMAFFLPLVKQV